MGHLVGILVGLAFVWDRLKVVMDASLQLLDFFAPRNVPGGEERGENSLILHVIAQNTKLGPKYGWTSCQNQFSCLSQT